MSSLNIPINEENCECSTLYWIPKFLKNQYLDYLFNKKLSITMTNILLAVKGRLPSYCDKVYSPGTTSIKSTALVA